MVSGCSLRFFYMVFTELGDTNSDIYECELTKRKSLQQWFATFPNSGPTFNLQNFVSYHFHEYRGYIMLNRAIYFYINI